MPTYEYRCGACKHEFELFQSITASNKRKCPECKKNALERLIGTGGAVIFKGGGFYETDYRSESYKKGVEAEKKASESKSDSASDSASSASATKSTDATKASGTKAEPKPAGTTKKTPAADGTSPNAKAKA
jgi:putative FmdB family regulatory protein